MRFSATHKTLEGVDIHLDIVGRSQEVEMYGMVWSLDLRGLIECLVECLNK